MECAGLLLPFGKTLRDAVKFYVAHLGAVSSSKTVRDAIGELLAARKADGVSARYLSALRQWLNRFETDFGDSMIASLSAKQITDWLRALNLAPLTRNTFRLRFAALFSFARRSGYVKESPLGDVEKAKERAGEIEILTVGQTARLLEAASAETLPYWAIGAFAGLRVAEIERLTWEEVDFERGLIEIKAAKAKTGSRHHVHIQPNLAEWLAPYRTARGPVCPIGLRKKLDADRERAGLLQDWPQNALRHSFGSISPCQVPRRCGAGSANGKLACDDLQTLPRTGEAQGCGEVLEHLSCGGGKRDRPQRVAKWESLRHSVTAPAMQLAAGARLCESLRNESDRQSRASQAGRTRQIHCCGLWHLPRQADVQRLACDGVASLAVGGTRHALGGNLRGVAARCHPRSD